MERSMPTEEEVEKAKNDLAQSIVMDCHRGHYGSDWIMKWGDDYLDYCRRLIALARTDDDTSQKGWELEEVTDDAQHKFAESIITRIPESEYTDFTENAEMRQRFIKELLK